MRAHVVRLAPIYMIGAAAGLLSVLASIGLFTHLLDVRQILVIAGVLELALVLSLVWAHHWHRWTQGSALACELQTER